MKKLVLVSILSLVLLSACGGGSSDAPSAATPPVVTTPLPPVGSRTIYTTKNMFGAWLWYARQLNKTHEQIATEMAAIGVKRIFIKIADGRSICSVKLQNDDACDKKVTDIYRAKGIEPWSWSYNYPYDLKLDPGAYDTAAVALTKSAEFGYAGHVLDIEIEFDGKSKEIDELFSAFARAREQAKLRRLIDENYLMTASSWGNPKDHAMRIDLIDKYVDAHMPQTYVEEWAKGGIYKDAIRDPIGRIAAGNAEYRALGAQKPIWHIVSTDANTITNQQLDWFFTGAGPNTSIWQIPDGLSVPLSVLDKWKKIDWKRTTFTQTSSIDLINYAVK